MAELAISSSPASSWGDTFRGILGTVVDTGAQVALDKIQAKQTATLAAQDATRAQAEATAAAASASAVNWQRVAIFGGAAVLGLVALALVLRRRS